MHTEPDSSAVQGWIQEAQGGNGEAFDRLARHYLPRIRRWALVRTGDLDDADDVVQRTLVQMYRKIGRFRGDADFGSWVYRITANAAHGHFRQSRSKERVLDRLLLETTGTTESVEAAVPGEGLRELVGMFLTELSDRQREMMDLVDFQGYTPAEAADMLGLNQNTARVHLLRGRRRIRTRILKEDPTFLTTLQEETR